MSPIRGERAAAMVLSALILGLAPGSDEQAQRALPTIPERDFRDAPAHRVLRVVSGDTVIVRLDEKARRIGLLGVDVPRAPRSAAQEARRFLDNLLKAESVYAVYAEDEPRTDQFGRHVVYLYRAPDGLFVNLELVRQGYACVPAEPAFEHRELFERFEARAKEARKGRWGPPAQVEPQPVEPVSRPAQAESTPEADESSADVIVYITVDGKKYHRAGCYHLRNSAIPIKLSEAKTRGYEPCSHCKPPE